MALAGGLAMLQCTLRQYNGASRLAARWFGTEACDIKRFCIVGAGPAGFYTADRLLKRFPEGSTVDLIDALPSPFGLVRSGVAPDHPDTKNVIHQFSHLAGASPHLRFFGNLRLGREVQLDELRRQYHAVVLAYGAESDRSLGIPGEAAPGVYSAREFVWWYNSHPSQAGLPIDLRSVQSVAVVGLGNVALDCARVLLQPPERLASTDIAEHALRTLRRSAVTDVHVIGRRGPVQASFTPKELRELLSMPGIGVQIHGGALDTLTPACRAEMEASRIKRRVMEVLTKAEAAQRKGPRTLHLHFLSSPASVETREEGGLAAGIKLEKQRLEASPSGAARSVPTGESVLLPADLVLKSIGYRSIPVPGLPFDAERGVVPNRMGQVLESVAADAPAVPGLFVVGWLSRGPSGIIGTNLADAEQTVEGMVRAQADWPTPERRAGLERALAPESIAVPWAGWARIDAAEVAAGEAVGKPREKMTSVERMLACAVAGAASAPGSP
ncbi:ARH1 [Auxenochlorella protothecoides x Auxenochlorella symbiontica]